MKGDRQRRRETERQAGSDAERVETKGGLDTGERRERENKRGREKERERVQCSLASDFYSPKNYLWEQPVCV